MLKSPGSGLALGGEVMAYKAIFLVLFAGIFVVVNAANAVFRKERKFYLWFTLTIISQTIMLFEIMK